MAIKETEVTEKLQEIHDKYKGLVKNPGAKTVYMMSPWWTDKQQEHILASYEALVQNPNIAHVSVPLFHQFNGQAYVEGGDFKPDFMWATKTYQSDKESMNNAQVGVLLETPTDPDAGSEYEAGYMTGQGKPVVAVYNGDINDPNSPVNLMISFGTSSYVTEYEELKNFDFIDIPMKEFKGQIV